MEEVFRSNNPVELSFATALLSGEEIESAKVDVHMSVLEGSIGVLPQRILVPRADADEARRVLSDNGLSPSGGDGA